MNPMITTKIYNRYTRNRLKETSTLLKKIMKSQGKKLKEQRWSRKNKNKQHNGKNNLKYQLTKCYSQKTKAGRED